MHADSSEDGLSLQEGARQHRRRGLPAALLNSPHSICSPRKSFLWEGRPGESVFGGARAFPVAGG